MEAVNQYIGVKSAVSILDLPVKPLLEPLDGLILWRLERLMGQRDLYVLNVFELIQDQGILKMRFFSRFEFAFQLWTRQLVKTEVDVLSVNVHNGGDILPFRFQSRKKLF